MREILFRGKSKDSDYTYGHWVHGNLEYSFGDDYDRYMIEDLYKNSRNPKLHLVNKATVGQYIGLSDANGEMIYEGDIIESVSGYRHLVMYDADTASFKATRGEVQMCDITITWIAKFELKIIGNMFDNPELLKGGK
jgi:uncharacterized phage protein (TIGR01671 family)